MTVSNIDSSGNDGVEIDFLDFVVGKNIESFVYDVELANASTFPLGAAIKSSSQAQINGVPNQPAGSMTMERVEEGFKITPDYTAIGSTMYELQIFRNGSLIFSQSGKTGSAAIMQINNSGKQHTTKVKFCCNKRLKYSIDVVLGKKTIKVIDGPTLSADLLVFKGGSKNWC